MSLEFYSAPIRQSILEAGHPIMQKLSLSPNGDSPPTRRDSLSSVRRHFRKPATPEAKAAADLDGYSAFPAPLVTTKVWSNARPTPPTTPSAHSHSSLSSDASPTKVPKVQDIANRNRSDTNGSLVSLPQSANAPRFTKILVGTECIGYHGFEEPRTFRILESQLCDVSDFFRTALTNRSNDAGGRSFALKDTEVASFEVFVIWLATGHLRLASRPSEACGPEEGHFHAIQLLIDVCMLGNRIVCKALQNAALTQIHESGREHRSETLKIFSLVDHAYEHAPCGHPLRKLLAMIVAWESLQDGSRPNVALVEGFEDEFWKAVRELDLPPQYPEKVDGFLVLQ